MSERTGADLAAEFGQLKSGRTTWEDHWQKVSRYVLPRREFTTTVSPGESKSTGIWDNTAILACQTQAAGLHALLTNPSTRWFRLVPSDPRLRDDDAVRGWLDLVEDRMFAVLNRAEAGFNNAAFQVYLDLSAFGTSGLFIGRLPNRTPAFHAIPLAELHIRENSDGIVDTVFRRTTMTIRQMVQQFGEGVLDMSGARADLEKHPDARREVLHAVYPRTKHDPRLKTAAHMPFASQYVDLKTKTIVSSGGFNRMPYKVARWEQMPGEIYGRSPGMFALDDARMVNEMNKTTLQGAQMAVFPPTQAPDDGFTTPIRIRPGYTSYYRADTPGRIEPIQIGARPDIGIELIRLYQDRINRTFNVHILQQLVLRQGAAPLTATEVLQRREESAMALAPHVTRMQGEFLSPVIDDVFDIMFEEGFFPETPAELSDQHIDVEYNSPLIQTQKSTDLLNLSRLLQTVGPLAQADPAVMENLNADEAFRYSAEVMGLPQRLLKSRDEVQQSRAAQEQAVQAQQAAALGQQAAGGLKDLAAAQSQAGGIPPELLAALQGAA